MGNNGPKEPLKVSAQFLLELDKDTNLNNEMVEVCSERPDYLEYLESKLGVDIYVRLMRSLSHKEYEPGRAHELWHRITNHKAGLNRLLGRNVGISVAALDYLTNMVDEINAPRVFEGTDANSIVDVATKDELTGLYARNVFDVSLAKHYEEAIRYHQPLSLILMDIDDFKTINDTFGHIKGDQVLQDIGRLLNEEIRHADMAARYGGEELIILLPQTEKGTAVTMANRIRENVLHLNYPDFSISVSAGVAEALQDGDGYQVLLVKADEALYRAKADGKNRVIAH